MKKLIKLLTLLFFASNTMAQAKLKPLLVAKPDAVFLKQIENLHIQLRVCDELPEGCGPILLPPPGPIDSLFFVTIKNAKGCINWSLNEYKTFIIKVTPLVKGAGIKADPDDGGEIFGDKQNSKEVYVSHKLVSKYMLMLTTKYKFKKI